jgi:hypothetical protein
MPGGEGDGEVERVSMRRSRERKGQKESKLKREEKKGKRKTLERASTPLLILPHIRLSPPTAARPPSSRSQSTPHHLPHLLQLPDPRPRPQQRHTDPPHHEPVACPPNRLPPLLQLLHRLVLQHAPQRDDDRMEGDCEEALVLGDLLLDSGLEG